MDLITKRMETAMARMEIEVGGEVLRFTIWVLVPILPGVEGSLSPICASDLPPNPLQTVGQGGSLFPQSSTKMRREGGRDQPWLLVERRRPWLLACERGREGGREGGRERGLE
ncbi:hypothetical protein L1049_023601 [Liquidambar formosana]|uniref:Uncharacterized protein n=1 Tax=Liquidambar formosana TaxID=63359 RepID=A0AAP0RUJ0_LIQFO